MKPSRAIPNNEKPVRGTLLDIKSAAEKSGMSISWLYQKMENGECPFPWFRLTSGKRKFDSADIDDWHRSCKVGAGKKLQEVPIE